MNDPGPTAADQVKASRAEPSGGTSRASLAQPVVTPTRLEDNIAYRIAVGAIGVALVAFLIGAAIIAAGGNPVPSQYWSTGSGLAGGLLGILAPNPTKNQPTDEGRQVKPVLSWVAAVIKDVWDNRTVVLLLLLFIASAVLAAWKNSPELETVAAAAGGALVGLLAPPPGNQQTGP